MNDRAKAGSPTIGAPDSPIPTSFSEAYRELQAIADRLKPKPGEIANIDEIEPLVKRANALAAFCQGRIAEVRKLVDEQTPASP